MSQPPADQWPSLPPRSRPSWRDRERLRVTKKEEEEAAAKITETENKMANLALTRFETPKIVPFSSPDDMVTFIIGAEKKKFLIHKDYACRSSSVFNAAFNSQFSETATKTYVLDDVDVETFRLFSQYMYSKDVEWPCHNPDLWKDSSRAGDEKHLDACMAQDHSLIRLWVLADRFMMPHLQNLVLNVMFLAESACGIMSVDHFEYIYEHTAKDSPLRQYLVDSVVWGGRRDEWYSTNEDSFPPELLLDIVRVFARQLPEPVRARRMAKRTSSDYHVSEDTSKLC